MAHPIEEAIRSIEADSSYATFAEQEISLPSELRIRQRLGEISTEAVFREKLFPKIERLGKSNLTPAQLIGAIVGGIDEITRSDENAFMGTTFYASREVPKIIDKLVEPTKQKNVVMFWKAVIDKVKDSDEQSAFFAPKVRQPKQSRRAKKNRSATKTSLKNSRSLKLSRRPYTER